MAERTPPRTDQSFRLAGGPRETAFQCTRPAGRLATRRRLHVRSRLQDGAIVDEREPGLGAQLQLHRLVANWRLRPEHSHRRTWFYVSHHSTSSAARTSSTSTNRRYDGDDLYPFGDRFVARVRFRRVIGLRLPNEQPHRPRNAGVRQRYPTPLARDLGRRLHALEWGNRP
jgi:hypothetical protein